jgi:hypothetical protein
VADLLITGRGGAGSSLAIMLGRESLAVPVFEKARFSRENPCGERLMLFCSVWVPVSAVGGCPFYGISLPSTDPSERKFIGGFGTAHPRAGRLMLRTDQVRISSQEKYTHDEEVGVGRSSLR